MDKIVQNWELVLGTAVVFCVAGFLVKALLESLTRRSAKRTAEETIEKAQVEADRTIKEAQISAKDELYRRREEFEKETQEARQELKSLERRISKREDNIDRKLDLLGKKEKYIDNLEREMHGKQRRLKEQETQLNLMYEEAKHQLENISGLTPDQAKQLLMERLEQETEQECMALVNKVVERTKEVADQQAREILATSIQRCAVDHTTESVVSIVDLPNDEMKGRIIGREGRNIRAFEKATGIDVVVDDTPGVVVVTGFDSIRREVARRAMEKLVADGRIHPARIEEVAEKTREELNQSLIETGKQACYDLNIHNMNSRAVELLGKLKFRTSYGQNVLAHSIEVAHLMAGLAGELKLDVRLARRIGLLHDIGKAVDQEMDGGHPEIGADLTQRWDERPDVVNAVAAHHEGVEPTSLYAVLVQAADAISASRPGARRETLEKYIRRLERLEDVAGSFDGVENAFAIQAGREVRVILKADKVGDKDAARMCREIAKDVEQELSYPGEVKITVIRETRFVEYAR